VSSLQPRPGHWLLRCPLCKSGFTDAAGALVCRNGHSFDLAREGTGHPLARIVARLPGTVIGLGLDISKDAARQAARRWPASTFAVADLWADWPARDVAVDLVVNIFAPRNFPEMRRVLRPDGWLTVAIRVPITLSSFGIASGFCARTRRVLSATPTWRRASWARPPSLGYGAARFLIRRWRAR